MAKHLTPKIRFNVVLITLITAIIVVGITAFWTIHQQSKNAALQALNYESFSEISLLKTLLSPVVMSTHTKTKTKTLNKALKKIDALWKDKIASLDEQSRYLLISKPNKTAAAQILIDVGKTHSPITMQTLRTLFNKSLESKAVLTFNSTLYLTIAPIYEKQFSLLIIKPQANIKNTLLNLAPKMGTVMIICLLFTWIILTLWKHKTLKKIQRSQSRYKQLLSSSMDWIWETDEHGNLTYSSEQCYHILGYDSQEMLGKPIFQFFLPSQAKKFEKNILKLMESKTKIVNIEVPYQSKYGPTVLIAMNAQAYLDESGKVLGYRGISKDITKQKSRQESFVNMAFFDELTQLPNRANLIDQLNRHMTKVKTNKKLPPSALLFIDLDGFKEVNDSQGHEIGDQLLKEISARMEKILARNDQAFRLAGDEFVVLIRSNNNPSVSHFKTHLNDLIQRLLFAIETPLNLNNHNIMVTASIGVALIPQDGQTSSTILSHADNAMYQAKRNGKNCYQYFDASMQDAEEDRKKIAQDIKSAIENNEFELHYQLQINADTQENYGMEALIRWRHPNHNTLLLPAEFITIATEANHIQALDKWVIKQATKDIAMLQKTTNRSIPVSINLSAKTLESPNLTGFINELMEQHFLTPSDLRLEVSETNFLHDLNNAVASLKILRKKGIQTSLDDFGTGHSNLTQLQTLPIDTLKIDKTFIDNIATSHDDLQICRSIIQLARSLNKNIIAEGVESEIQQKLLTKEGCYIIQGFLYAKPQPIDKIIQSLLQTPKKNHPNKNKSEPGKSSLKMLDQA